MTELEPEEWADSLRESFAALNRGEPLDDAIAAGTKRAEAWAEYTELADAVERARESLNDPVDPATALLGEQAIALGLARMRELEKEIG